MANPIRIKRRTAGDAGPPASLLGGEIALNEVDDVLYAGRGDTGDGTATSIIALAGPGAFVNLSDTQTIGGVKTFSSPPRSSLAASGSSDLVRKDQLDLKANTNSPALTGTPSAPTAAPGTNTTQIATTAFVQAATASAGGGDMMVATYDGNGDGKVDAADAADAVPWTGVTGKPATFPSSAHTHAIGEVSGLQGALDLKAALASPALTGTPTAPTATAATNTTQIATTAFVQAVVSALIDAAPGTMDTLNELAAALGDDPNFAATVTSSLAGKLTASSNLSDLTDAGTARGNLGLGSMATQAASAVAITGGTIDGVTLDGGTF